MDKVIDRHHCECVILTEVDFEIIKKSPRDFKWDHTYNNYIRLIEYIGTLVYMLCLVGIYKLCGIVRQRPRVSQLSNYVIPGTQKYRRILVSLNIRATIS